MAREDIPNLFKNPQIKDVSHEYFDTINVNVKMPTEIKNLPSYAYLCVYNHEKWEPIQWGKISKNQATFLGMGKDVLYLPSFYLNGCIQPIENPFYISPDGKQQVLSVSEQTQDIYVRSLH